MRRVLAILACVLWLSGCAPAHKTLSPLTLYALEAGEGEAFILSCGGQILLIDTARQTDDAQMDQILNELDADGIDAMILTHFEAGHVGAAPYVMEHYRIGTIIEPDFAPQSTAADAYFAALENETATRYQIDSPIEFCLGDAVVTVYPSALTEAEECDRSLITTVTHGQVTYLFAADATELRLEEWLRDHPRDYTFLKAPHHGDWNPLSKIFYMTVDPQFCLIPASSANPVDDATLSLLRNLDTQIHITKDGPAVYHSDGSTLTKEP